MRDWYEDTLEFKRAEEFKRQQEEKYLTERTPEEMWLDMFEIAEARMHLAANLQEQADQLRAEATEMYIELGFNPEAFDG